MLGPGDSVFPARLSRALRERGMRITLLSDGPPAEPDAFDGHSVPRFGLRERSVESAMRRTRVERVDAWLRRGHYAATTGRPTPDFWEWRWAEHAVRATARARAADRAAADFVFAHEATSYGYAATRTRTRPRFLFPWGGDVFLACESSRGVERLVRRSLHAADLIMPSSRAAADRIVRRFDVPTDKVKAVSWGADLSQFRRLSGDRAAGVRRSLGLPVDGPVIVNARRLREVWGAATACDTIARVLSQRPDASAIVLGGGTPEDYAYADRALRPVSDRVAVLREAVPLDRVAELFGVADVALSLMPVGDMRSSSVVQAAAAGAFPVVVETPEYAGMAADGFGIRLVPPKDAEAAAEAVLGLLSDPGVLPEARDRNAAWLAANEDESRQMDRIAALIREQCVATRRTG